MPAAKGKSAEALADIKPEDVKSVDVTVPGSAARLSSGPPTPGKPLELPGNWPVRRNEVEELVGVLAGLKSRFQPVAIGNNDRGRRTSNRSASTRPRTPWSSRSS